MKPSIKDKTRMQISELAAQIIETEGIKDYLHAKKKAAARLGINSASHMPANDEIQQSIIHYQNLFYGKEEKNILHENAIKCLHALELLNGFKPYLTGAYAGYNPSITADIEIILFLDEQEKLVSCLKSRKIPWQLKTKKMKLPQQQTQEYSSYQFYAENTLIKIICLPEHETHTHFIDPVSNKKITKFNHDKSRQHLMTAFIQ